jgi:hypothetical protein
MPTKGPSINRYAEYMERLCSGSVSDLSVSEPALWESLKSIRENRDRIVTGLRAVSAYIQDNPSKLSGPEIDDLKRNLVGIQTRLNNAIQAREI